MQVNIRKHVLNAMDEIEVSSGDESVVVHVMTSGQVYIYHERPGEGFDPIYTKEER